MTTMIILNTQGIVLKAIRYKENDVILTLFTRKLGKVSAIAKGAKRNKSSLLSSKVRYLGKVFLGFGRSRFLIGFSDK